MRRYTVFLLLILIASSLLRFVGLTPGYHPFHPDESTIYSAAIDFIKNNNFVPEHYEYPAVANYINYIFFKSFFIPLGWFKFVLLNIDKILDGQIRFPLGPDIYNKVLQLEILGAQDRNALFWTRYVTALFGVGVVYLTYLVGQKLFNRFTGLISALFVSVNYRQVLNSHLGLPDIYNAFFFLLSFWSILRLREKFNLSRLFLCGIILGLYISTKYQFYPLVPLAIVFVEQIFKARRFDFRILIVPFTAVLVFILLNPYLFINLEVAIEQISYASLKYATGRRQFMLYPYWYLFNIGIGKITSFLVILGMVFALIKERMKLVLVLAVVVPFFIFFTYLTGGGFYTRNFVSITPFLLILAAYFLTQMVKLRPQALFVPVFLILMIFSFWENLINSLVVIREYRLPWNRTIVAAWLEKKTPHDAVIAAHSSVPIPGERIRISYDRFPWPYFSLAEFAEGGAGFAVTNLDWMDADFYGWMQSNSGWGKPLSEMRDSYVAMTLNELTDYGLYEAVNPWQAPDSNFIVAKVPRYNLISKDIFREFQFNSTQQLTYWQSEPITVERWEGFEVVAKMKMDTGGTPYKDGFIFAKYYSSADEAKNATNYRAIRLSPRDGKPGVWVENNLMGKIPVGSKYLVLGFSVYDKNQAKYFLDYIKLYKAEVDEDLGGASVHKIKIDENILFPNSHGNL